MTKDLNLKQLTSWVAIDILTRYLFTAMIRFKLQNYRLTISKNHRSITHFDFNFTQ